MNICIFGATGKTGAILLKLLLSGGHHVTAAVRTPTKVTLQHENLDIKAVDLFNTESIKNTLTKADLVISCLGGDANNKSTLLSDMIKNILTAMKSSDVKSIFYIGSAGIHGEMPGIVSKIIVNLFYKNAISDHKIAAEAIMNSGFNYLIMRPLSLFDGDMTKKYRLSYDSVPKGGSKISREDLAYFLSEAVGKNEYANKSICICY